MSDAEGIRIYVALLDEGVEVWRPVAAAHVDGDRYRIESENENPEDEHWEFGTGQSVRCRTKRFSDSTVGLAAIERG